MESDSEMIRMLELADQDFKATVIYNSAQRCKGKHAHNELKLGNLRKSKEQVEILKLKPAMSTKHSLTGPRHEEGLAEADSRPHLARPA